jgi:tetratricopeptide (TPR) repeat protein
MNDQTEQLLALQEKAKWAEKYSVEKSDILLQALRLAESLQDAQTTTKIRGEYIDCLCFQGRLADAYPHFSILISQLDDPNANLGTLEELSILWKYKWFLNSLPTFPNIPKAQILDIMDDMERRYLQYGALTQSTVYYYKDSVYSDMGDLETALEYRAKYEASEIIDFNWLTLSDCSACISDSKVGNSLLVGNWEQALQFAQPILSGEKKCESVPKRTYFKVALAFVKTGQKDEAALYFEKGMQLLKDERIELDAHRRSICYLVYTGQWERALAVFERHFPEALNVLHKSDTFHFYSAGVLLFRYIARTQNQIEMRLPDNALLYQSDGTYNVPEVVQLLDTAVQEIAAQFDNRNENDYYSRVLTGFYPHFMPVE